RRNFGVKLDWSDSSVQKVEQMLGRLHDDMAQSNPPEEAVWTFAKAFGSYVGEVLRKHHGGGAGRFAPTAATIGTVVAGRYKLLQGGGVRVGSVLCIWPSNATRSPRRAAPGEKGAVTSVPAPRRQSPLPTTRSRVIPSS